MQLYLVFVFMATMTILSPGPGVLRSLTNALTYGIRPAMFGILGLSGGVFCVAAISATSLGVLLSTSVTAFKIIKYIGVGYLVYLGIKLWRSPAVTLNSEHTTAKSSHTLFVEGWMLQLSNPNAVFFFLSVLPQFIHRSRAYLPQFLLLVCTFCALLILIHSSYAVGARRARRWVDNGSGGQWLNRIGGAAFIGFGLLLARSKTIS